MNKANVFLLVVVSSLLTYISTATQPASASGAAQEKWEYGFSHSTFDQGEIFLFSASLAPVDNWTPDASVHWTREGVVCQPLSGGDPILYASSSVSNLMFDNERLKLWHELGNNGWHPYFVIPNNSETSPRRQYLDTVYWRRRVQ